MKSVSPAAIPLVAVLCSSLLLGGCTTEEIHDLQRSVSNVRTIASGSPTGVHDMMGRVRAASDLMQTMEKYRRLSMAEQRSAAAIAQRRYDILVAQETERLRKAGRVSPGSLPRATRPGESAPVGRTDSSSSTSSSPGRKKKDTSTAPEPKPEKKKPASAPEMSDADWQEMARKNVESEYGTDFAVPVKNPEGKSVVALASVKNGKASVEKDAYVLNENPRLSEGLEVSHNNRTYKVVNESIGE